MSRRPSTPIGACPLEMRAETAAAFCDEPSVESFQEKVPAGKLPAPLRQNGCQPKWHREKLKADIDRRHGLRVDQIAEDLAELI